MTLADAQLDAQRAWELASEEDADSRLWSALRASPTRQLPLWCRRCGYGRLFGEWRPYRNPHPTSCPNCHSSYWDRPGVRANARRPSRIAPATQEKMRAEAVARRRLYRHKAKVRELEAALPRRAVEEVTTALEMDSLPVPDAPQTPPRIAAAPPPRPHLRRTVPPPPGLDELERDGGTR
jgi:hypothetical protein